MLNIPERLIVFTPNKIVAKYIPIVNYSIWKHRLLKLFLVGRTPNHPDIKINILTEQIAIDSTANWDIDTNGDVINLL